MHITSIRHLLDWLYICVHVILFANSLLWVSRMLGLEFKPDGVSLARSVRRCRNEQKTECMNVFCLCGCARWCCSCRSYFVSHLTVLQKQHMPKLLNKSQNLKFYRYNSIHKSFEVFHIFCHPRHTHTHILKLLQYSQHGISAFAILLLCYGSSIFCKQRHFHLVVSLRIRFSVILIWFPMCFSLFFGFFFLQHHDYFDHHTIILPRERETFLFLLSRHHIHFFNEKKNNQMVETCPSSWDIIMFGFQFFFSFYIHLLYVGYMLLREFSAKQPQTTVGKIYSKDKRLWKLRLRACHHIILSLPLP